MLPLLTIVQPSIVVPYSPLPSFSIRIISAVNVLSAMRQFVRVFGAPADGSDPNDRITWAPWFPRSSTRFKCIVTSVCARIADPAVGLLLLSSATLPLIVLEEVPAAQRTPPRDW